MLAQPVGPVFRLEVVCGNPIEILEDDMGGRGEIEADAAGHEVADRHAHVVIGLVRSTAAIRSSTVFSPEIVTAEAPNVWPA
jgi:hypothetical protein